MSNAATPAKSTRPSLNVATPASYRPPSSTRSSLPPSTNTLRARRPVSYAGERQFASVISLDSIQSPRSESPRGQHAGLEPEVVLTKLEQLQLERELEELPTPQRSTRVSPRVSARNTPLTSARPSPRVSSGRNTPLASARPSPRVSEQPTARPKPQRQPAPVPEDDDEELEDDLTEEEERLMIGARMKILKRSWPEIELPDVSQAVTIKRLRKLYELYRSRILAEECSGGYKKWLLCAFILVEVISCRLLKFDMSGFTVSQMNAMGAYQELLLELAEKYGGAYKGYFPVELRLAFAVGLNSIIFFVAKRFLGDSSGEMSAKIYATLSGHAKTDGEGGMMNGILGGFMNMLSGGAPKEEESVPLQAPARRRRRRDPDTTAGAATAEA